VTRFPVQLLHAFHLEFSINATIVYILVESKFSMSIISSNHHGQHFKSSISNAHVQRLRTTKFHPTRINPAELWRHIDFSRWRQRRGNSISDFVYGDFAQLGSRNLLAYQSLVTFLNTLLRYYYFWFLEANIRHVGILLPVSILIFAQL